MRVIALTFSLLLDVLRSAMILLTFVASLNVGAVSLSKDHLIESCPDLALIFLPLDG